jgi:hypothetical protein
MVIFSQDATQWGDLLNEFGIGQQQLEENLVAIQQEQQAQTNKLESIRALLTDIKALLSL